MKRVYVFDVDGTLIDSMGEWAKAVPSLLEEKGIPYPDDLIKRVVALGLPGVSKYLTEHFPLNMTADEVLAHLFALFKKKYADEIGAKEGARETLLALKERGVILCTLTAGAHILFDACLQRLGLWDLFDYCWSTEDFPVSKADPAIYALLAQRLGVSTADCVMVDDSISALAAAVEGGVCAVGIYDDFSKDNEMQIRAMVNRYIYRLEELL